MDEMNAEDTPVKVAWGESSREGREKEKIDVGTQLRDIKQLGVELTRTEKVSSTVEVTWSRVKDKGRKSCERSVEESGLKVANE